MVCFQVGLQNDWNFQMSDERLIITPKQAATLLPDGEYIHNFANPNGMMIGCDFERSDAIKALNSAKQIEIGGDQCKSMNHALVVWDSEKRYTFFATDADRVEEMERTVANG